MDYQKNLPLPLSGVSQEYYKRQLGYIFFASMKVLRRRQLCFFKQKTIQERVQMMFCLACSILIEHFLQQLTKLNCLLTTAFCRKAIFCCIFLCFNIQQQNKKVNVYTTYFQDTVGCHAIIVETKSKGRRKIKCHCHLSG